MCLMTADFLEDGWHMKPYRICIFQVANEKGKYPVI